jgi:NADPH oxidase 1
MVCLADIPLTFRIREGRDAPLATINGVSHSISLSRGTGLCIAFDSAFILLPMLRTTITTMYFIFDFLLLDGNIWFH